MYPQNSTGKASKGSVSILNSNGRLQLRFSFGGKRHYLSTGYPDTHQHRKLAEIKAKEIEKAYLPVPWLRISLRLLTASISTYQQNS